MASSGRRPAAAASVERLCGSQQAGAHMALYSRRHSPAAAGSNHMSCTSERMAATQQLAIVRPGCAVEAAAALRNAGPGQPTRGLVLEAAQGAGSSGPEQHRLTVGLGPQHQGLASGAANRRAVSVRARSRSGWCCRVPVSATGIGCIREAIQPD